MFEFFYGGGLILVGVLCFSFCVGVFFKGHSYGIYLHMCLFAGGILVNGPRSWSGGLHMVVVVVLEV